VVETGKKIVKPGGMIIINDFALPRYGKLSWDRSWFGTGPNYVTNVIFHNKKKWSKPYEFIRWKNARCLVGYDGKHINEVLKMINGK
jgi:hypothetical protein